MPELPPDRKPPAPAGRGLGVGGLPAGRLRPLREPLRRRGAGTRDRHRSANGQVKESPRKEFIHVNDDGQIVAMRYTDWKVVFLENRGQAFGAWREPFTDLRVLFNRRVIPSRRPSTIRIPTTTPPEWRGHRMDVLYRVCCGLDVHKKTVVACLRFPGPTGKRAEKVRTFRTTTRELLGRADWLTAAGCTHVAIRTLPYGSRLVDNLRSSTAVPSPTLTVLEPVRRLERSAKRKRVGRGYGEGQAPRLGGAGLRSVGHRVRARGRG